MPDFTQTFLVTALPDSIDGSKLRLAVLVSPRLTAAATEGETAPPASAPLSSWPDAQNWPSIAPVWEVTIEQGTTKAVLQNAAEIGAGGYDVQTWNAIFPGSMPTTPYQPPVHPGGAEDPSYLPPVATFPVSALQDAVKKLHVALLTDHRTAFPPAEDLQRLTEFVPIKDALSPQLLTEVLVSAGSLSSRVLPSDSDAGFAESERRRVRLGPICVDHVDLPAAAERILAELKGGRGQPEKPIKREVFQGEIAVAR